MIILGLILVQYFVDRRVYNQGHAAYQDARCSVAIDSYNTLIEDWRLFNLGGFIESAERELSECIPFQAAEDQITGGDYSAALIAHYQFMNDFDGSALAPVSRRQVELLFTSIYPDRLASEETCPRLDTFRDASLIPKPGTVLPPFYYYCGLMYDAAGKVDDAFDFHRRLLVEYPGHELSTEAETALMGNPISCREAASLAALPPIADRIDFMPSLYYTCGQAYDAEGDYEMAFDMYEALLTNYPEHPLAGAAEESIWSYQMACDEIDTLEVSGLAERPGFKPKLYHQCGLFHQANQDYDEAIQLFEQFLAEYPDHDLAPEVETSLAEAIVDRSKGGSSGEIPRPELSGSTGQTATIVIIQNDSPQRLRIVFSGPESRIEELGAGTTCENYSLIKPMFCPEKGRDEYSSCFFIVETFSP
jgi:tetratricopeptide (TPR) repeat protein